MRFCLRTRSPKTEVEMAYIRDDDVEVLLNTSAQFGMTMGHIMYDDLSLFARYNRLIGKIGVPWLNVPVNHELNCDATCDTDSLETYT